MPRLRRPPRLRPEPVRFLDRRTGQLCEEKVLGEALARWFYETPLGSKVFRGGLRGPAASRLYGRWKNTRLSATVIRRFISETGIDLGEVREPLRAFKTFNSFFARRLKPEARPIDRHPDHLISLGDGKVLVYPEIRQGQLVPIKGAIVPIERMLDDAALSARYEGGSALVLRLAPADYHRFHFIDDGMPSPAREIAGAYDSVNPIALGQGRPIFAENRRSISTLQGNRLGLITHVEVGAFFVGSIVQTFQPNVAVTRGDEKGFFQFGGSTVVLLLEPGRVRFDDDLVAASAAGTEVAVRLGERVGLQLGQPG